MSTHFLVLHMHIMCSFFSKLSYVINIYIKFVKGKELRIRTIKTKANDYCVYTCYQIRNYTFYDESYSSSAHHAKYV